MKIDESKFRFRVGDKIMFKGKEYKVLAYYFDDGFNNYNTLYGYTIDYRVHSGAYGSYDENGTPVEFPNNSAHFIGENLANPILTIADRLRYAPKGLELYSPLYGKVHLKRATSSIIEVVNRKDSRLSEFYSDGRMYQYDDTECLLFPSKDNRDWTTVDYSKPKRQDLKKDTLCIVTDGYYSNDTVFFRYYSSKYRCFKDGKSSKNENEEIMWNHIVPVDKFDFNTLTYKPEDDYGKGSKYEDK